jgi:CBS domain-containing protein
MRAGDIMTARPECCTPDDTAEQAAHLMAQNDCGCLPVVDGPNSRRLIGIVTDRDIAIRAVAHGRGADTPVRELMTSDVACCTTDSEIVDVERLMMERQVRRIPIIDDRGCCIGIIAQADLARQVGRYLTDSDVSRLIEQISERGPSEMWEKRDDRYMRM